MTSSPDGPGHYTPPPATPRDRALLDTLLIQGIAWATAGRLTLQLLTLASTVVVARLIDPADYGIVGMSSTYLGLANLLADLGVAAVVVQRRHMTQHEVAGLATLAVVSGLLLFLVSLALAAPIAAFYLTPALTPVIWVASAGLIIASVRSTSVALMTRDFQFKRLAALALLEGSVASLLTLLFAFIGLHYWSLVIGNLVASAVATLTALCWRPYRLAAVRTALSFRTSLVFGGHVVASRIAWHLWSNADTVIVGRLFGSAGLGAYGLASVIANAPLERIVSVVGQVTPSVFSAVQHDIAEVQRYFLRICAAVSLLMFPLSAGVALVSDLFVVVALGDKWSAAILPMQLLAACAIARALGIFASQIILALGRSDIYVRWSFLLLIVLPPLFYFGSYWGIPGVAAAWLLGYPIAAWPAMRSAMKLSGTSAVALWRCILPAVRATVVMTISVLVVRHLMSTTLPPSRTLLLSVVAGAVSYLGTLVLVNRDLVPRLWLEVRRLRSGTREA